MNSRTWLDLNDAAIVPPLGARTGPDMGPVAGLVCTEPDLKAIRKLCGAPDPAPFFMGSLFYPDRATSNLAVAGPYVGAPYGAMLLESMIARGVDTILVLGWCGAVSEDLKTGDILVPDLCIADEGTSRNYTADPDFFPRLRPSASLSKELRDYLVSRSITPKRGPVWTTDAIYRETRAKVNHFRDLGAWAVDMECSALCAVAAYRKVRLAALLMVSDELYGKAWNPGFRNPRFREARRTGAGVLTDFLRDLAARRSGTSPPCA